jgi:hypothetical protein
MRRICRGGWTRWLEIKNQPRGGRRGGWLISGCGGAVGDFHRDDLMGVDDDHAIVVGVVGDRFPIATSGEEIGVIDGVDSDVGCSDVERSEGLSVHKFFYALVFHGVNYTLREQA